MFQSSKTSRNQPGDNRLMSNRVKTSVWPVLTFADAPAAIAFLTEAFGFEEGVVLTLESDSTVVTHGELWWPLGGGVMLGSAGKDDTPFGTRFPGNEALYIVTDDPDGLFRRATAAGAEVVNDLADEDYGSRGFTVSDPEGNLWSFGTYTGE